MEDEVLEMLSRVRCYEAEAELENGGERNGGPESQNLIWNV